MMVQKIVYEVALPESNWVFVCFKCAAKRAVEQDCFVYTNIEECNEDDTFICDDCECQF